MEGVWPKRKIHQVHKHVHSAVSVIDNFCQPFIIAPVSTSYLLSLHSFHPPGRATFLRPWGVLPCVRLLSSYMPYMRDGYPRHVMFSFLVMLWRMTGNRERDGKGLPGSGIISGAHCQASAIGAIRAPNM